MSLTSWEIQTAIYNVLVAASPAIAGGRIYAPAAPDVVFPHVEIGESQQITGDVQCRAGGDEFVTLHVWSRPGAGQSYAEVKQICGAISTALHAVTLSGASLSYATAWVQRQRVLRDPDGVTLHGTVEIRVEHYS